LKRRAPRKPVEAAGTKPAAAEKSAPSLSGTDAAKTVSRRERQDRKTAERTQEREAYQASIEDGCTVDDLHELADRFDPPAGAS
jgi:hypothetical protein